MMSTEKNILVQKCLQVGHVWVCSYEPELKKQSLEWKHNDISDAMVIKEVNTDRLL